MNPNPTHSIYPSDEEIAVLSAKIRSFRALNGVVRMMVEVDPNYYDTALCWFGETGSTIAMARIKSDDE